MIRIHIRATNLLITLLMVAMCLLLYFNPGSLNTTPSHNQIDSTWAHNTKINIYVLSFNRLTALKRTIKGINKFFPHSPVTIIDNGSDYPELISYFRNLTKSRKRHVGIIPNSPMHSVDDFDGISKLIERHKRGSPCDYFIVTDPDIEISADAPLDLGQVLTQMLVLFPQIQLVGPMLKVDDIPEDYIGRDLVLAEHINFFWSKQPRVAWLSGGRRKVYYQISPLDTTFAMYRCRSRFQRLQRGVRLYYPYEARHLDWYATPKSLTADQRRYLRSTKNNSISHWLNSGYIEHDSANSFRQPFTRKITVVERDDRSGRLVTKVKKLTLGITKRL